ncbi:hypothetical protein EON65_41505 [archaeon]|nr:MAG: hypothetical protein EON65_41505 [archaeon]
MVNDLLKVLRVGRTTQIVRSSGQQIRGEGLETPTPPNRKADKLPQKLKELRQDLTNCLTIVHNFRELNILSRSSDRRLKLVLLADACVDLITKCTVLSDYPVKFDKDFMLGVVNTPYRQGERRNLIMQAIDQLRHVLLLAFFALSQHHNQEVSEVSPSKSAKRDHEMLGYVFKLSLDLDKELEGLKQLDGKF